jgi:hypothetical protein
MWRLNPQSSLHYRHWGNEWAVFDVASGQTHEMSTVSAVTLMHCENGWVTLPQIITGVMTDLELPPDTVIHMEVILSQFADIGLLEYMAA